MAVLSISTPPTSPRSTPRAVKAELSGQNPQSPRSPLRRALSVALFRSSFSAGRDAPSAFSASYEGASPQSASRAERSDSPKRPFRRISLSRPSTAQSGGDSSRLAVLNRSRRSMSVNAPNAPAGSSSGASSPAPAGSASPASCSTEASLLTPSTTTSGFSLGTPRAITRARRLSQSIQHRLSQGSACSTDQIVCKLEESYQPNAVPQHATAKPANGERRRMSTFTAFFPDVAAAAMSRGSSLNTERGQQPRSSIDTTTRRRLIRRSSDESFQCRGLEADDSDSSMSCQSFPMSDHDKMNAGLGMFEATPKRNPVLIAPSATERMSHFTRDAQQSLEESEMTASKASSTAFLPGLLGLRRKSGATTGSARTSLMRAPLAEADTNIPVRPRRPDSFYFISPSPSSISSFTHEPMLDDDDSPEDEAMDTDEEVDSAALASEQNPWSPTCLPTPPSSIRLRLAFSQEPASPSRRSSAGGLSPASLKDVFIGNAASALELKELISERISTAQGFLLSPRQLSLSVELPYVGAAANVLQTQSGSASALGLDLDQSTCNSHMVAEANRKELDNDDLLYQQGLVDDDTVLVRVRPIYSQFI
ncbi:hypothetical protein IE81DRAFT_71984 [Ceraceosorus guamensis]|uniref:Ubiquitin-like domain-containing protein n=1 Tax=Ceraceosorus guamensis TaxID=1522189 RepID=A0A316W6C5_9BASI|nr:hypothetical protein IE81DRAFT_71984 [Ceraceosorus guamensis]PWN43593.1 hypothetical protein IE81DRAFT_71984 [Ceraceosorus guamensis]